MNKTYIAIKCGILEPKHRDALGIRIWLYLYMLDKTDWETGRIIEWTDKSASDEMAMPIDTLRLQRNQLEEAGYITCEKTQHAQRIIIHNWTNPREYSGKVINQSRKILLRSEQEEVESLNQSLNQSLNTNTIKVKTPTYDSTINHQITSTAPKNGAKPTTAKPKPEPKQAAQKQTVPKAELDPIMNSLATITRQNITDNNRGRLLHFAKTLYLSKYTAETIQSIYGSGGAYWRDDWRGKKGQFPNLASIQDSIDRLAPKAKPKGNPKNPNGMSDEDYAEALEVLKITNPKAYQREIEARKQEMLQEMEMT